MTNMQIKLRGLQVYFVIEYLDGSIDTLLEEELHKAKAGYRVLRKQLK